MARALVGHVGSVNEHQLVFEVARLRRRVAELETELAELRAEKHIDVELHCITEAVEPALA